VVLVFLRNPVVLDWLLNSEPLNPTLLSALTSIPMILMLVIYFRYVFGFFMRNSERQADLYALKLIGHPFLLVSSLRKIAFHSGQPEDHPSWHHYSIRQRIDFLLRAYEDPAVIRKHHQKYYTAMVLFFFLVAGLSTAGFGLERSKIVRNWRTELQLAVIEREINRGQVDQKLYAAYGSILLERGQFAKAESVLRRSLEKTPEDANTLNNLAWLYATSPPPYFKPQAALELALRAAALEPDPTILDTLAEAYYVNGEPGEALKTIQQAILKQPNNLDYFLSQKQKFEAAVRDKREGRRSGWEES
jgi:tetratricopeptide (TPR) repeat protein